MQLRQSFSNSIYLEFMEKEENSGAVLKISDATKADFFQLNLFRFHRKVSK